MPIPDFSTHGYLPDGIHDCTFNEVEQKIVSSNINRQEIWQKFKNYYPSIKSTLSIKNLYIDGGFVTRKTVTSDIDIIIEIDPSEYGSFILNFHVFHQKIKDEHKVDLWPKIVGFPNDFVAFFQYVKTDELSSKKLPPDTKKGILRITDYL